MGNPPRLNPEDEWKHRDRSTSGTGSAEPDGQILPALEGVRELGERYRSLLERMHALTEHSSDIVAEVDSEGRLHYLSPSFAAVLGRDPADLVGKRLAETDLFESLHPADSERLSERFDRGLGAGKPVESLLGYRFRRSDGSWRWFESRTTPYHTSSGEVRELVLSRDVTERVQAAAELRESEERYRILAETSRDLIVEMDEDGQILWVNPGSEKVLGYPPEMLIGRTGFMLIHPDDIERNVELFLSALKGEGAVRSRPHRARHRDGSWHWVEGVGVMFQRADGETRILAVSHDITERVEAEAQRLKLEERMRQAQKLESMGIMAGGIAHDFNNLLTPILGDASLALLEIPAGSPTHARVEKIRRSALRAASLTHQMLAYAGGGAVAAEPLDLSQLVREMAELLEAGISGRATVVYRLARDLPLVYGDEAQLSQVVMNLISNAVEATSGGDGRIVIETGGLHVDTAHDVENALGEPLAEGPYVYLEVSDSGVGMDAKTRLLSFDPFYTTKFTGRGLGLAVVLGIVRAHGGAIEIETEPGHGTRFRVMFPHAAEQALACAPAPPPAATQLCREGTILVIDDDEGVREFATECIERAGMKVVSAASGREGIAMYEEHRTEIRAVVLDRTMPDISGDQVFDEILRLDPSARVVLVSGFSEERAAASFPERGVAGFLKKPFLPESLIERVRQALSS